MEQPKALSDLTKFTAEPNTSGTTRSVTMQESMQALSSATRKYGGEAGADFLASRSIAQSNNAFFELHGYVKQKLDDDEALSSELKSRLIDKTRYEAVLVQGVQQARANESILKERLMDQKRVLANSEESLKSKRLFVEDLHNKIQDIERRIERTARKKVDVENKVNDLQSNLEMALENQRRASQKLHDTNRGNRTMEREYGKLEQENQLTRAAVDREHRSLSDVQNRVSRENDEILRDLQQHQIKSIALEKELSNKTRELDSYTHEIKIAQTKCNKLADQLQLFTEISQKATQELMKRLNDEEDANNKLCEELAAKSQSETAVVEEVQQAEASREVLISQLDDKVKLSLELGKRLHALNLRLMHLQDRLSEKNELAEELTLTKEMVKSEAAVLSAHLDSETTHEEEVSKLLAHQVNHCTELDQELSKMKSLEVDHRLRLRQAEANQADLEDRVKQHQTRHQESVEAQHEATVDCEKMREKFAEAEMNLSDATAMYEKVSLEYSKIYEESKKIDTDTKEFNENFSSKKNDIDNKMSELDDELRRLDAKMKKSENEMKNMNSLLEEEAENLSKDKLGFGKEIRDLEADNNKMATELRALVQKNAMMESDRSNSERRIQSVTAQMAANENTASNLANINREESAHLTNNLNMERNKMEKIKLEAEKAKEEAKRLRLEYEELSCETANARNKLRDEKFDEEKIEESLEENKGVEVEQNSKLKSLETYRDLLSDRKRAKTRSLETLKPLLNDQKQNLVILKKELKDSEIKEADLLSDAEHDQKIIDKLTKELKQQEQQHIEDAMAVKQKITILQSALQEKVDTVARLEDATTSSRVKAMQLQERLEQTEAEASEAQNIFEKMLDDEQESIMRMRQQLEGLTRDVTQAKSVLLKREEATKALQALLTEKREDNETYSAEAFQNDKKRQRAVQEIDLISNRQRALQDSIDNLEETVSEVKLQLREKMHTQNQLEKELSAEKDEMRLLKSQYAEKSKTERVLNTELTAKRLNVLSDNDGKRSIKSLEARKNAESEYEQLMHSVTDEKA
eukprot:g1056.t1